MSDNEDLLADELEEQSLADYNLGNEEEEQLLADDYEIDSSHNVPTSISSSYQQTNDIVPTEYSNHAQYRNEPPQSYQNAESECVVPNIIVEVPNVPQVQPTYAPYNEAMRDSHAIVPAAVPAAPLEPPQIVPSDLNPIVSNGDTNSSQEQFVTSRQRTPQIRDIPDSLDKVFVGRGGGFVRGRTSWRNPRYSHPYRRNNRGNFNQRASYPPQQIRPKLPQNRPEITPETRIEITLQNPSGMPPQIRPEIAPQIRPELAPQIRPELAPQIRPELAPQIRPEIAPQIRPEFAPTIRPELAPQIRPEIVPPGLEVTHAFEPEIPGLAPEPRPQPQINPELPPEPMMIHREVRFRPPRENRFPPNYQRFPGPRFMGPLEEGTPNFRPAFEPPMFQRPFAPRPSMYPVREVTPNSVSHLPQVTIRQSIPGLPVDNVPVGIVREQEVRMLPLHLPPIIPPGGLQGKKVLINPHFKGNFQRPDGVPTYIPTRIQKSPPLPTALESKFGPIKDIDDAAERFIAEQRSALASRAARNRRSPQRYIENTTIEIANDLAAGRDRELLRRQEEFINANRAGLRRRMRSPSPPPAPRRSPSPPRRRPEPVRHAPNDVDGEYRRKVREQETLRERVLRAKEVRRRKNAVLLSNQLANREREREEKNNPNTTTDEPAKPLDKEGDSKPVAVEQDKKQAPPPAPAPAPAAPTTPPAPPVERDRSPIKTVTEQKNVTENLTPPRPPVARQPSPERALTPPLPIPQTSYDDDDLDLILDDIEDILSDEDETGRFKDTAKRRPESPRAKPHSDLRSKLASKAPKQKIVFTQMDTDNDSSTNRNVVSSSTKNDAVDKKTVTKKAAEAEKTITRQKIVFENKDNEKQKDNNPAEEKKTQPFSNRRVVIRRTDKASARLERDASKPNPGIFSRAVRLVLRDEHQDQPKVETVDDGDEARETGDGGREGDTASVTNLPPGITHTRLRTLAGDEVQSLILDKEDRSAKITFKTSNAALTFKRKFNNKMVAASRLTVSLT